MTASTITEVKELIVILNSEFKHNELHLGQRYGYKAIDLYKKGTHQIKRTLITGITTTNAYDYLNAMINMAEILINDKKVEP